MKRASSLTPQSMWRLRLVAAILAAVGQVGFSSASLTLVRDESSAVPHAERSGVELHHGHNDATCADSIALVKQLEKELGQQAADTGAGVAAQPRATGGYMNIGFVTLTDAGWSTESDVASIERGDHDPKVNGFTMPNAEISLDGAVDPYFKGFSNIVLKIDSDGETGIELEEAYALTTSLPHSLQIKFGQFFTEFGRQNPQHPHAWGFVDAPLVMVRMFGPDGCRSQGVRFSWLQPTPFYPEARVTVGDAR